jgi:hypothetical protein
MRRWLLKLVFRGIGWAYRSGLDGIARERSIHVKENILNVGIVFNNHSDAWFAYHIIRGDE